MNNKSLSIAVVAAVAVMLVATSAVATEDAFAGKKKYEKSQASSQANACGNGFMSTNVGCQNTDSQIQGDENGVAQTAQQTFPEVDNGHDNGHHGGHDGGWRGEE
jgi:hypothetical protein